MTRYAPISLECRRSRRLLFTLFGTALLLAFWAQPSLGQPVISRVKDISTLQGIQDNPLIGYGLVAGLAGTGDGRRGFTARSLNNMLSGLGINVLQQEDVDTEVIPDNVAAVMVMADLPPFARPGTRVDATVVSIGRAESLQGGYLIQTPLRGADNNFYGLAYGPISIGGFVVDAGGGGGGASVQQNHTVVGVIPNGVVLEGETINHEVLQPGNVLRWLLHNPDYKTATNLQNKINGAAGQPIAMAEDAGAVRVRVGANAQGQVVIGDRAFNSLVEAIAFVDEMQIETDAPAKIIINERTGTIVAGSDIRVHQAVVAHGPLRITIQQTPEVTPAGVGPGGEPVQTAQTEIQAEEGNRIAMIEGTTVAEVVQNLNQLGYTPRDLIAILEAMARQGAIRAEIEKM